MKRFLALLLILALLGALTGCGADISAYADDPILITGLTEEPFTVTAGELRELKCVSATAVGSSEKAGTVKACGPTLETFVESYGRTLDEFHHIRFTASDDYDCTVGSAVWEEYDVILSVANGSEPLEEGQQPLRVVIPGYDSGKWIRLVNEIEFVAK